MYWCALHVGLSYIQLFSCNLFMLLHRYFVGYFARAEVVIGGGDSSDCPTYINGKCFSCPSDCTMTSTAISGDSDFVCNCKCADGSETKCIVANAPAPLAEEYQAKLEEGKEKLAEGQEKLAEGRKKLEEEQKKLEEAKQMMGYVFMRKP